MYFNRGKYNHQADAFIFSSLNVSEKMLTICGWIPKKDFKELAKFYKKEQREFEMMEQVLKALRIYGN